MARKSRKNINHGSSEVIQTMPLSAVESLLPSAAYVRLSSANEENGSSIESQMSLVHNFIRQNTGLKLEDTYIDNGYTGTNFERPEFDRMMQDVRTGRIRCIVVKDLSRFGRDYLEMGYYLEKIFPRLNVRFIAVTDDFDSSRPDDMTSISVPIKNIVNNYYANDISKKLVTANEARRQHGDLMSSSVPYGYRKENHNYIIDEETACYVRVIYQWFLMGVSKDEIARRLEFVEAPHPCMTKSRENTVDNTKWRQSTIKRQLSNPSYTGDLVGGKSRTAMYKGLKKTFTNPDEWMIRKDDHPAIVLQSDFEKVQNLLQDEKVKNQKYGHTRDPKEFTSDNPFPGIVYCGCCGKHMAYAKRRHSDEEEPYGVFFCPTKTTDSPCGYHVVTEKFLKIMVMDQIRILVQTACDQKELAKSLLDTDREQPQLNSLKKKINALSGQIDQTEKRKADLYEDYASGLLNKEEYQYMKEHYILEKQEKQKELHKLQEELHTLQKKAESCIEISERLEPYKGMDSFDEKFVCGLVKSITVGLDNTIHVVFKCRDVYQELTESMGEICRE